VLRTVSDTPTLWESVIPECLMGLPGDLAEIDALLDDPRFFEPFRAFFDPAFGRPSIPMETYLRLMFLKYRYRLGYETLCAEVSDSLTWLRFCRIPLGERAPHPSTLMKITTRCGSATVAELNAHLIAVGVEAGVIDMGWLRADTTVVPADIKYPTDSGLLTKGISRIATIVGRLHDASRRAPTSSTRPPRRGRGRTGSRRSYAAAATTREPTCSPSPASSPIWPRPPLSRRNGSSLTPGG
jgi:transposase, IS5 family